MISSILLKINQSWYLTFISSVLCVLGCSIIFFEEAYQIFLPRWITRRYKFKLKENYVFLNGALSLSSGCLLFTALFRLLPEALVYFKKSANESAHVAHQASGGDIQLNAYFVGSYITGIVVCLCFTALLHLVTSESVVHCSHSDGNSHTQKLDLESGGFDTRSPSRSHRPPTRETPRGRRSSGDEMPLLQEPHMNYYHSDDHLSSNSGYHSELEGAHCGTHRSRSLGQEQTNRFLAPKKKTKSLIQMLIPVCNEQECVGECKGYSSAQICMYEHSKEVQQLHFCEIPTLGSVPKQEVRDVSLDHTAPDHHAGLSNKSLHSDFYEEHDHDEDHDHEHHEGDHHHHISTPFSRLLLLGVQNILAIALHKFPEGFMTFTTTETNKELGFSIFLSLAFHNFTEGFSMCLPLYFSFGPSKRYAKLKAFLICSLLGGLSQPCGAFLGWLFLKYSHKSFDDPESSSSLNFVFGIIIAVTSGFLTVVGLSMYGSAVSFHGGASNFVLLWALCGMSLIGITSIFTL
ncbi:Piso0_001111 [Millerozyma farinosa CBS 7064]|uniref:Piso0_001111 protein n=1 Tax=Pichia sorbitophila (strain ATCC MYA-4447 / BCRC 22081 / CBS 7064 / NBRC 10061 / NRRL Y-12695) TaxID=559304 RepID=G8YSF1_PICSO|nr:Piso0_001111 [Millerozyma farinosa CBS 7064]CCE79074.1 Piso0_001111 [Millerozyma farinosa CBS 7064]